MDSAHWGDYPREGWKSETPTVIFWEGRFTFAVVESICFYYIVCVALAQPWAIMVPALQPHWLALGLAITHTGPIIIFSGSLAGKTPHSFWREMTERNPMSQETKKGASCFCMDRVCLKMRPRQVGCEGKRGRERWYHLNTWIQTCLMLETSCFGFPCHRN